MTDIPATLKAFATDHGGSATAVVSHLGRRGARIVLVGADGTWGDAVAADMEAARSACEAAGVPVAGAWERELAEAVKTSGYEWGLMGRGRPVRTR
jgi:DNA-binding LacI/PurR family transcriptional regulator